MDGSWRGELTVLPCGWVCYRAVSKPGILHCLMFYRAFLPGIHWTEASGDVVSSSEPHLACMYCFTQLSLIHLCRACLTAPDLWHMCTLKGHCVAGKSKMFHK